jgi:crotonobetainyl-CoA:carnitine CoA-transferase CaiB-like acyl-CoA transferase
MAGLFGAFAVQVALRACERTGKGQVIDIALYEGIFRILDEVAPAFQRNGFVRRREGAETPIVVPHSHYPTVEGRWIAIACTNDRIFARLAEAMCRAEMIKDERYATNAARIQRRSEVNRIVAEWTSTMTRDEALKRCAEAEVPCGPVYGIDEIFEDPHYRARGNILRFDDPRVGTIAIPNTVPRLDGTPGGVRWLGPPLGSHTNEILSNVLNLDSARIDELRRDGVV